MYLMCFDWVIFVVLEGWGEGGCVEFFLVFCMDVEKCFLLLVVNVSVGVMDVNGVVYWFVCVF